jgi:PAS domain S-box-containing protein
MASTLGEFFGQRQRLDREFRRLVESCPLQLWATRPDGYHDYFNERVLEYTGLRLDELSGTRALQLIHRDDFPTMSARWSRSLATGLPYEIEYRLRAGPHGDYRWFLGRAIALRDERGTVTRWLGTCTDIDELKLAQERLAVELEAEQRARGDLARELHHSELFAGELAHDLRSPLTAISFGADSLKRGLPVERSRDVGARIATSSGRMSRMIDQLLDFTRIRANRGLAIRRTSMELAAICEQVIGEIQSGQRQCPIELTVVGDTRGCWDPERLAQMVSNLVGNAVRHGEPGLVETTLDGRDPEVVVFAVHNRGAIPSELMPHLFDPFRQGTENRGGLGLGLFITKQIVEAHRGSVSVCSSPQTGTSFHVRLPREAANPSQGSP